MALFTLCYGRVSTLDQNIELQISQFESIGYDQLFVEKVSGRRRDRPEFLKLTDKALELRSQGHQVRVYVIEFSRWARDTAYSLETLSTLDEAGVEVIETTTGQPLTLKTSAGLTSVGLKALMAHAYSLDLSERLKRSHAQRRQQQRPTGGPLPWGYLRSEDKSQFIPNPDEWAFCRVVIERFLEGETLTGLIRWLWHEHDIRRSAAGLKQWLINPVLRGHLRYKDGAVLYDVHEPLITEAEYRQIQQRLDLNRRLRGKNKGRIYAVPTIVHCAACGEQCSTCSNRLTRYFFCYRAVKRGEVLSCVFHCFRPLGLIDGGPSFILSRPL